MLRKLARLLALEVLPGPAITLPACTGMWRNVLAILFALACASSPKQGDAGSVPRTDILFGGAAGAAAVADEPVRLAGHGLSLGNAVASSAALPASLTVTLTLRRDDEDGFQEFLHEIYDPKSPQFHRFLTQAQIADRFGPSQSVYDRAAAWLGAQRLAVTEGSVNRLTITASGARTDVERAFGVHLGAWRDATHEFFAYDREPALPASIGAHVVSVSGLSTLAQPRPVNQSLPPPQFDCPNGVSAEDCDLYGPVCGLYAATRATGELLQKIGSEESTIKNYAKALNSYNKNLQQYFKDCLNGTFTDLAPVRAAPAAPTTGVPWLGVDGSGQTVGIVAFDSFHASDVSNYLSLIHAPAAQIGNLSVVTVNGGATLGAGESEVLLDIDAVMTLATAANVVVYSAPFTGSFQAVFNSMLGNNTLTIISNSWAYCENQTSAADVQGIDTIMQNAAVAGVSVFSATGDSGSTCLDGAASTITVPADVPDITAVGGTTLNAGAGGVYKGETWWDGSTHTPPTGKGGFGVSKFFARPPIQNGFTASTTRSIPDVSAPADPVNGLSICQDDAGGCPTGLLYGGTSLAAPAWAAFTALLNQSHGSNLGFMNIHLYPLSATNAFHNAASMGSDFAHVGLGSPNLNAMSLLLNGQLPGTPDAAQSEVLPTASPSAGFAKVPGVPADGTSAAVVVVTLRDANGNTVPGKTVTLAGNPGNHATITPPSGISSVNSGTVAFTVTNLTPEVVTFKATDTSDGVIVTQQPSMTFVTPPAASASVGVSPPYPTAVASDGAATATIMVTLEDSLSRPTPGKSVRLHQNHNSLVVTANPAVTDVNGHATFNVSDTEAEVEFYSAVDETDGNLNVPGGVNVNFTGSSAACVLAQAPLAFPGYRIDVYVSGFPVQANSTYGGVNIFGCIGVTGIAFDGAGNLFASGINGDVYKLPPGGGVASNATKLATNAGQGLGALTFGKSPDGNLYGVRLSTDGTSATTGAVVKINQSTGAAVTVASNITCPFNIATDPLSGDLFVPDFCGFATASPTIVRVANPGSVSPTVSAYADSDGTPNGSVSVASDGTLYVVSNYFSTGSIDEIAGTNEPLPPSVTPTGVHSTYSAAAFGSNPDGGAEALITSPVNTAGFVNSVAAYDMTASPPSFTATLLQGDLGAVKIFGPDNCLYLSNANAVYKVSNADGSCPLAGLAPNPSVVLVPEVAPTNFAQGTAVNFDVTFPHTAMPEGTPVQYSVTGANHFFGQTLVGANNSATFTYTGPIEGKDTVMAYANIGGDPVASNPVLVTWNPNKHVSQLNLDTSDTSATLGTSAIVSATLLDMSLVPIAPVSGATIQFTLTGQSCSAITDLSGHASCRIAVSALTQCTLEADYLGGPNYLPSSASVLFSVSNYDVLFTNGFEPPLVGGGCIVYN